MPLRDDLDKILPDQLIKNIAERKLLITIIILSVTSFCIIIALAVTVGHCAITKAAMTSGGPTCRTPACLHTAGWLADNMDPAVDPCTDFYAYACGGWEKRNTIPPDRSQLTVVDQLYEEVDEKLREIIERIPVSTSLTPSAEDKLQIFFKSCVHDYGRAKDAGKTLISLILSAIKGWYVLSPDDWNSNWNFQDALASVQGDLLVNTFFSSWLERDSVSNRYILGFYYTGLGLNSYYDYDLIDAKSNMQEAYREYMRRVCMLLLRDANVTSLISPTEQNRRVEQFVSDVYGLETAMATMMKTVQRQRGMWQRVLTTVGELQNNMTQLDWLNVLGRMFNAPGVNGMEVSRDTPVRIGSIGYFRLLDELLRNETDAHIKDRVVNNFLVWKIAAGYASELSWEYRETGYRYMETLYGEYEWPPTWKVCMDKVHDRLGSLLALEFIKTHLGDATKSQVVQMYGNIQQAITARLSELDWMDNVTTSRAREKINAFNAHIGFAEVYYNATLMETMHADLEITREAGYFTNLLSIKKFQRRNRIRLFIVFQDAFIDHLPLLGVPAHYYITPYLIRWAHTLIVPAGSMLDPLYNPARPQVFNYGVLGSLLAGEMLKAVDETGRYMWINSSSANWWTNNTWLAYKKSFECFEKYFDQMTVGPFFVNGQNLTVQVRGASQVSRLMADLGGIRLAYMSYKQWKKTELAGLEELPSGLDLTPAQTFFVSSVQTKCFLRTDALEYQFALWRYIPENIEVNTLLSHLPEFTEAFQCPKGSPMSVAYQCSTY